MQFLKTLFWVVLAVAAVIFAMRNWTIVTVNLWGGMLVDAKLPVLLFGAFAAGFLPTFIVHRATRWQLKRRLDSQERVITDMRAISEPAIVVDTLEADAPVVITPTPIPLNTPSSPNIVVP